MAPPTLHLTILLQSNIPYEHTNIFFYAAGQKKPSVFQVVVFLLLKTLKLTESEICSPASAGQEDGDAPACAEGRPLPSVAIQPSIHPSSSPESLFIIIELHSWQPIKQDILFLTTCSSPLLHPILRHQSFSVTGAPKSFLTAL